jgi:antitoxin StbD
MLERVSTKFATTISEFKKNPNEVVALANNDAFAVLTNNKPSFYVVPPSLFETMLDMIDEIELARIVNERRSDESTPIKVDLKDLY